MSVNIKIVPDDALSQEGLGASGAIKIKILKDEATKVEMLARRALNGDIMVYEHDLIDVVVSPSKKKVVVFPKDMVQRETYPVQNRFFQFLYKKGVIDQGDVQGGNVYSSLECKLHESVINGVDEVQSALFAVSLFMEEERPDILARKHLQHDLMTYHLDPDEEDSTELGEVPQSDTKGSLDHRTRPYGYQYMYSLLREGQK
ncbi:MAG: hypothetical protein HOJ16_01790 [Candidatus Peribacter sp.]|jgi:hypothetical protein|nr:hypothetical protein [Candidatus Peribacter sp.]